MTNNETIVNGNMADDEIIEIPEFVVVDLDDPKNNDLKPYLDGEKRLNYVIDNDWVIYSHGYECGEKPIMIRNGVKIIKWIWRNFSVIYPCGFLGTPYDLHNYIRFKEEGRLIFDESPGAHLYALYEREYEIFIDLAFSHGKLWVANRYFRARCGLSFRKIPYFTQCFSSVRNFWVIKNDDFKFIDFASVFYYLYLRDEYDKWIAEWGINRLTEIREGYDDKQ